MIKVLEGLVPSEGWSEKSVPCLSSILLVDKIWNSLASASSFQFLSCYSLDNFPAYLGVFKFPLFIRTQLIGLCAHFTALLAHLNLLYLQSLCFQIRSCSKVLRVMTSAYEFWGTIFKPS